MKSRNFERVEKVGASFSVFYATGAKAVIKLFYIRVSAHFVSRWQHVFNTTPVPHAYLTKMKKKSIDGLQMCLRCFSLRHVHASGNSSFRPPIRVSGPPLGVATLLIIGRQIIVDVGKWHWAVPTQCSVQGEVYVCYCWRSHFCLEKLVDQSFSSNAEFWWHLNKGSGCYQTLNKNQWART